MDYSVVLFDKTKNGWTFGEETLLYQRYREEISREGFRDAVRERIKELARNKQKFEELVIKSEKILFRTKTIFPFDMFPDEITINPVKVSVVSKDFFRSIRIHCIYIKNILDVFLDSGPLFATLRIVDQSFTENTVSIQHLKKSDALQARKIIQGLIVAHQQEIDVASIHDESLVKKLEILGHADGA
jgi:hypothetical protein